MDAMHAALKKRQGKGLMSHGDHMSEHQGMNTDMPQENGKDLHGLVQSLSHEEKGKLKQILAHDQNDKSMQIAKGGSSSEEDSIVSKKMDEENKLEQLEDANEAGSTGIGEDESDDIAKSMLDSRHMRGMANEKPRNLGERMKQGLASKLKSKGKI